MQAAVVAAILATAPVDPASAQNAPTGSFKSNLPDIELGNLRGELKKNNDYDKAYKEAQFSESRAKLLAEVAAAARKKADTKDEELAQKSKAVDLVKKLDNRKTKEEVEETKATEKKLETERKVLEQLEKKPPQNEEPKAQVFFRKFFQLQEKKAEEQKVEILQKEDERSKVLAQVEKNKKEAQKAAQEAEEVALRIEKLAIEARRAADAAKALAAKER